MNATLLTRGDLVVDKVTQKAAESALTTAADEAIQRVTFHTETGRELPVDPALAQLLAKVVARIAQGGQVNVATLPERMTTSAAADFLGVSRTTVMKLIASGELPATKVGTHHRLQHGDVLALKQRREKQRAAVLDELLLIEDDD